MARRSFAGSVSPGPDQPACYPDHECRKRTSMGWDPPPLHDLNVARASHAGQCYGCNEPLPCGCAPIHLRTNALGTGPFAGAAREQRVRNLFVRAGERAKALAGGCPPAQTNVNDMRSSCQGYMGRGRKAWNGATLEIGFSGRARIKYHPMSKP